MVTETKIQTNRGNKAPCPFNFVSPGYHVCEVIPEPHVINISNVYDI
jgi:hypothetical protein